MMRLPDYERGRFFISPILGCHARCHFCYIYDKGYKARISRNSYSIEKTIEYLKEHDEFIEGRDGSIISIGAWGDPFPRHNKIACSYTLSWLERLAQFENPIQIMSRYNLHQDMINGITSANTYNGHILYSTSLSSISNFKRIEPYADSPDDRLKSLRLLQENGIATNVMIKPFISGITNLEVDLIAEILNKYNVKQCVVGGLLLDDRIKRIFLSSGLSSSIIASDHVGQVLDCTSGESHEISVTKEIESFSSHLDTMGIIAFKKSSCVNSFILKKQNPANYINSDPNGFCIKCGVCK